MGGLGITSARRLGCVALLVFGACASQQHALDLARNEELYRPPNFHVKLPADRFAFVTPVVDDRQPVGVADASGPYPTRWMADQMWERPMAEMIDDCLRESFTDAGVFAGIETVVPPSATALIVEPHLTEARGGLEERVFGRRTVGSIGIRLVVKGPVDGSGERPVLIDEDFGQTVGTGVSTSPDHVPVVMGRALQQVVARLVAHIDQSNVARSGL